MTCAGEQEDVSMEHSLNKYNMLVEQMELIAKAYQLSLFHEDLDNTLYHAKTIKSCILQKIVYFQKCKPIFTSKPFGPNQLNVWEIVYT